MSYWMPTTGIRTKLPVACLRPAAGAMLRQARPTDRGVWESGRFGMKPRPTIQKPFVTGSR